MKAGNRIIPLEGKHWPEVVRIFQSGIESGISSLETKAPDWETWDGAHHPFSRFVFMIDDTIAGWAALSPVSKRACYSGVAEVSIYFDSYYHGKGYATDLMQNLINDAHKNRIWTLQSHILKENSRSIRFHEKFGFEVLCIRKNLGNRNGKWHDIVLMERRNSISI